MGVVTSTTQASGGPTRAAAPLKDATVGRGGQGRGTLQERRRPTRCARERERGARRGCNTEIELRENYVFYMEINKVDGQN